MTTICLPSLVPTLSQVYQFSQSNKGSFSLPFIPIPLWSGLNIPTINDSVNFTGIQSAAMFSILKQLADKIIGYLGGTLSLFFPNIPILNISLIDIFTGSVNAISLIKDIIINQPLVASGLSIYTKLPIFNKLDSPDISALIIFESLITEYIGFTTTYIFSKINNIANNIGVSLLSLPLPLPSKDTVVSSLLSIAGVGSTNELFNNVNNSGLTLQTIYSSLAATFGSVLILPTPWYTGLSIPELEFQQMFNAFMNNLISGNFVAKILEFVIDKLSSVLSNTFTPLCF